MHITIQNYGKGVYLLECYPVGRSDGRFVLKSNAFFKFSIKPLTFINSIFLFIPEIKRTDV